MIIKSSTKTYTVNIEKDLSFFDNLKKEKNLFFAIDRIVYKAYFDQLFSDIPTDLIYLMDALESNKTIETALSLCDIMTNIPAKRNAHLVSIGGGIVQDISGFAANILYRGIFWTYIPTTLLAACDSCIGGKTSLNYKNYKNMLGTFFPPDQIYISSEFFKTLSERDFLSGLGEVVKFNIMAGQQGLIKIEKSINRLAKRDQAGLNEFLITSLQFKQKFIEEDEFDHGIRIQLNFAHTFGHAFETVSQYAIPHGTAVAMGMLVANRISLERGLLTEDLVSRTQEVIKKIVLKELVPKAIDINEVISAIRRDKKQVDNNLTGVLLTSEMKLKILNNLQLGEIERAFNYVLKFLERAD